MLGAPRMQVLTWCFFSLTLALHAHWWLYTLLIQPCSYRLRSITVSYQAAEKLAEPLQNHSSTKSNG
jgi:hypothetical protein